jgi:hypothetical protein
MAGKRRIVKSLGYSGCGLEAQSRYLPGRTSENWENCIKIVQRPGRNSQRTPSEFLCIILLLHLQNTYAELYYYTYRIHMQTFAAKPTEYICRTSLLHLPNSHVEPCYYTYRINIQSLLLHLLHIYADISYQTYRIHLPYTYADLCCCTYRIRMQSFAVATTCSVKP